MLLSIILMALVGAAAGLALDALIVRFSREPFERAEIEEHDLRIRHDEAASVIAAPREFEMPRALTTGSAYRRAAVVALTALAFALVAYRYDGEPWHMAGAAAFACVLIVCAGTDVLAYRVPNAVTYPAAAGALLVAVIAGEPTDALFGGLITGGVFLAMAVATRGGMGMGDVKLAFVVGFALGVEGGFQALLVTALAGGLAALVLLLARRRGRKDPMPYAPFIAIGALVVMLTSGIAIA